jgi:hypothetical protein
MKQTHEGLAKLQSVVAPVGVSIKNLLTPALASVGVAGLSVGAILAGMTHQAVGISKATTDMKLLADQTRMTVAQIENLQAAGKWVDIPEQEMEKFARQMAIIHRGMGGGALGMDAQEAHEFRQVMVEHGDKTIAIYNAARAYHDANPEDTYGFILKVLEGIHNLKPDEQAILLGKLGISPSFARTVEAFEKMGPIFHDDADAAKALTDSVAELQQQWKNNEMYLVSVFRPTVTAAFKALAEDLNKLAFEGSRAAIKNLGDQIRRGISGGRGEVSPEELDEYVRSGKVPERLGPPPAPVESRPPYTGPTGGGALQRRLEELGRLSTPIAPNAAPAAPGPGWSVSPGGLAVPSFGSVPTPAAPSPGAIPLPGPPPLGFAAAPAAAAPAPIGPAPRAPAAAPPIAPATGAAPGGPVVGPGTLDDLRRSFSSPAQGPSAPIVVVPVQPGTAAGGPASIDSGGLSLPPRPEPITPVAPAPGSFDADLLRRQTGQMFPDWSRLDRALGGQTGMSTIHGTGDISIDIKRPGVGIPGTPASPFRHTELNEVEQMGMSDVLGARKPGGATFDERFKGGED